MKLVVCYGSALVLLFWAALLAINGRRLGVVPTVILMVALAVTLALNFRNSYDHSDKNGPNRGD